LTGGERFVIRFVSCSAGKFKKGSGGGLEKKVEKKLLTGRQR
jgi:hypothetical protein